MNKEIARKWADALRSGEYKQGRGSLRIDGYCCLGVLCDLAAQENVGHWQGVSWRDDSNADVWGAEWGYKRESKAVRKWCGLQNQTAAHLAQANDTGSSFDEIASMIEKDAGLVT